MQTKLINAQLTVFDGAEHSGERYMPSEYAKTIMKLGNGKPAIELRT